ncbi:fumarylacetoacetate hydrolase family protein [Cerasicoccus maritimus]|uniref:fumarylacetoacetate hydrolase family protein n=1 Tax=Cerasicoccus maritimus TaxID=490089 RepID=UPI00285282F6|nr:fumarylacetoacetate hydrolase family protein [Cerasicoccus maritimus]
MRLFRIETTTGETVFATREGDCYFRYEGGFGDGFTPTKEQVNAARILAPVPPGNTIYAIGLNYREHAREMNKPNPDHPVVTMKSPASIIATGESIELPRTLRSDSVDFEAELAVVIGKTCKNATLDNALSYVVGYTVANDVSARDWQKIYSGGQWCKGKGFDTFCPLGPVLVTADELTDPNDLRISSRLNGETFQDSSTCDLIFTVEELIVFLSGSTTLMPGTIILTGTPEGVGTARTPPRFLQAGDVVEIEIDHLGVLTNPVVEEPIKHPSIHQFYEGVKVFDQATMDSVFAEIIPCVQAIEAAEVATSSSQPLAGLTCLIKDNFDLAGFPTHASSLFLELVRPAPHVDGPLVQTIKAKGLTILGKTQMNEFAYGLDGANPHTGNCPHPFDPELISGGSSSGSAWAVAKQLVDIGFGTDTGGSIRVPSAFCGLYGLRLTPSTWATEGCVTLAPSFDTTGWMAYDLFTFVDASLALLDLAPTANSSTLRCAAIGPMSDQFFTAVSKRFPDCADQRSAQHDLFNPNVAKAFSVLQSKEAYAMHEPWIADFREHYDPAVLKRILRAEAWTEAEVTEAHAVRTSAFEALEPVFENFDIVLLPVSESPAPQHAMSEDQREELLRQTAPASLAGLPVVTIPLRGESSTSLGLQCLMPADRWQLVLPAFFQLLTSTNHD